MGNILKLFVAIGAFAAVHTFAGSGEAFALTELTSPFGPTVPVNVFVSANSRATAQLVAWQRKSDGVCAVTQIGDSAGLWDNYRIHGSSGNDLMRIVGSASICNLQTSPLVYGGYYLDMWGGAGNDTLSAGNGNTWLSGGDGDDSMFFAGQGALWGGNGNDTLIAGSSFFTVERLFGEEGNDCLADANGGTSTFDCGPGADRWSSAQGSPMNRMNCETQITTTCP